MQNRNSHYNLVVSPWVLDRAFPLDCGGWTDISDAEPGFLHRHDCLEIGYCADGHGVFMIDHEVMPFQAGDLCVIGDTQFHIARSAAGTTSRWRFILLDPLCFLPAAGVSEFPSIVGHRSLPGILSSTQHSGLCTLFLELADEMEHRNWGHRDVIRSLLGALLTRIERHSRGKTPLVQSDRHKLDMIAPALSHIVEHYGAPISVPLLAGLCSVTEVYLRRLFRQVVGLPPQEYVIRMRMKMATVLLANSVHPITRIAQEVGCDTVSSFNRHFQRIYGVPPRDWRRHWVDRRDGPSAAKLGESDSP